MRSLQRDGIHVVPPATVAFQPRNKIRLIIRAHVDVTTSLGGTFFTYRFGLSLNMYKFSGHSFCMLVVCCYLLLITFSGIYGQKARGRQKDEPASIQELFNTSSCIPKPYVCPHKQIQFYLYTRPTRIFQKMLLHTPAAPHPSRTKKKTIKNPRMPHYVRESCCTLSESSLNFNDGLLKFRLDTWGPARAPAPASYSITPG
ncbi:hypothetical protein GWI33_002057 [Rhynchophorus ferrugineus]|uniref:Uncharacterized protein n=1 Tax=Rhynchophorus ferrugineus TaxID=354439 RepID=A0A834IXM5_RHYFE|nr:hypothetical protein GWI33_002057 [Rhynchophorus ferrugineus]